MIVKDIDDLARELRVVATRLRESRPISASVLTLAADVLITHGPSVADGLLVRLKGAASVAPERIGVETPRMDALWHKGFS